MAILAGWLSKQPVPERVIEERLLRMAAVLEQHGGERALVLQPGAGLVTFAQPFAGLTAQQKTALLDWLPGQQTFVYRRPLVGWHPLYYARDWPEEGDLLFASEIKALLAAGLPCRLFPPALEVIRRYGFLPAPWTAFTGIEVVPAGSLLRWQQGRTLVSELHDYRLEIIGATGEGRQAEPGPGPDAPPLSELDAALRAQCERLLSLPTASLLVLTAGTGAAALCAELLAHCAQPLRESPHFLQIATLGFPGQRRAYAPAEALAERLEADFLAVRGVDAPEYWLATLSALEAPCSQSFPLALHQVLHTAGSESGARLALIGLGARPLLAPPPPLPDREHAELLLAYSTLLQGPAPSSRSQPSEEVQLWTPEVARRLAEGPRWEETRHARRLVHKALQLPQSWQRWRYLDLHLRLPDLLLQSAQQLAAFDRLTLVAPFVLPELLETLAVLPPGSEQPTRSASPGQPPDPLSLATLLADYSQSAERASWPATALLSAPVRSLAAETVREREMPLSSIGQDLLAETLAPAALAQTGIFAAETVERLKKRSRSGRVPRELVLVFTTQLLCKLFGATL